MRTLRATRIIVICAALAAALPAGAKASRVDFLIPGMSLDSVSLVPGARVSYLVISSGFGAADSSVVELRVLERRAGTVTLEVLSSPYPKSISESTRLRMRLSEGILRASSPEEARACVREVLVRNGTEPYRAPTAKEREEFDIEGVFSRARPDARRTSLGAASLATPAGTLRCALVEYASTETRAVFLGGVEAVRRETIASRLWLAKEIPFWGLARSRVEKTTATMEAGGAPRVLGAPKTTLTESVILSYRAPRGRR